MSTQSETLIGKYLTTEGAIPRPVAFLVRNSRFWMGIALATTDLLALTLAGVVSLTLRLGNLEVEYRTLFPLVFVFIGLFALRGLYPGVGLGEVEELHRLVMTTSTGFILMAAFTFIQQTPPIYSRLAFLLSWVLALIFVPFFRYSLRYTLSRWKMWGEPVAIIGPLNEAEKIIEYLRVYAKYGMVPVIVFEDGHGETPLMIANGCPVMAEKQITRFTLQYSVRTALVISSNLDELDRVRQKYRDIFQRVIIISPFNTGTRFTGLSVQDFGEILGLQVRQNLMDPLAQWEKRAIDLVGAILGMVLISPLLFFIAALVKLDSPGPVFYHQKRVGKNGDVIKMLKFRSMHVNADEVLAKMLAKDPSLKQEWDCYQKLMKDPRITRVGAVLRRFSLDELPQLWNVIIGEMSLVGPRPLMLDQKVIYMSAMEEYKRVRPGISGLWQISGRNKTTFARRAEWDVYYVMNWSVWLDIYILIRTVWVVLRRDGAY